MRHTFRINRFIYSEILLYDYIVYVLYINETDVGTRYKRGEKSILIINTI